MAQRAAYSAGVTTKPSGVLNTVRARCWAVGKAGISAHLTTNTATIAAESMPNARHLIFMVTRLGLLWRLPPAPMFG
jgi:hypothetical protein